VLYEMLSGKRAFAGESVSDTLATVLKLDPDWTALPAETPASIRRLIQRCLTKDRKQRLQAIGEARIAIDKSSNGASTENAEPVAAHRLWLPWSVAAVLAVGLAAVAFLHFSVRPPVPVAPVRFQIPAPENTTLTGRLKLSPDGRKLAFLVNPGAPVGGLRLWVHFMESGESRDLTAAGGSPFWSPDSRFIGYPFQNKIRKIEATGGAPQTVADFAGSWGAGAWNQDDVIVFGSSISLFRVPASGGVPIQITTLDPARHEGGHCCPSFLPDGRHFVYTRQSTEREKSAIYLGSIDTKPEQQISKPLVISSWGPVYAPSPYPRTGYLLFMRERALMAQPFDDQRMELTGQAALLAEQVADNQAGAGGFGAFSASANDVLVFQRAATFNQQLTWYNREGKFLGTAGEPGEYPWGLALSPDGMRLALSKKSGLSSSNIYSLDLARNTPTRLTFGSKIDSDPVWSPDGSRIIFSSNRDGGKYNLYQKLVSGVKDEEVLLKTSDDTFPTSWSRDGRFLLYEAMPSKTKFDIRVLPMVGDKNPVAFHLTEFSEAEAIFSPDGHWVAYASNESGRPEVYVRSFSMKSGPAAVESGIKSQISNGGAAQPRWRGDGRELYYRSIPDGKVMAVDIATAPTFRPGTPRPLGPAPPLPTTWPGPSSLWDFAADGKRFLAPADVSRPEPFTVVLNWQAGLKRVK
jgi:Tol biopolymer transport system component